MRSIGRALRGALALLCAALAAFSCGCVPREEKAPEALDCSPVFAAYDALCENADRAGSGDELPDRRIIYECRPTTSAAEQRFYFGWDERGQTTKSLFIRRGEEGYFSEFSYNGGEFISAPHVICGAHALLADREADAYLLLIHCRDEAFADETYVYDPASGSEPKQRLAGRVSGYSEGLLRMRLPGEGLCYQYYSLTAELGFARVGTLFETDCPAYFAEAGLRFYTRRGAEEAEDRRMLDLRAVIDGAFGDRPAGVFIDRRSGVACVLPVSMSADGTGVSAEGLDGFDISVLSPAELYALACPEEEFSDADRWKSRVTRLRAVDQLESEFDLDADGDGREEHFEYKQHAFDGESSTSEGKLIFGGESLRAPMTLSSIGRLELADGERLFFLNGVGSNERPAETCFIYRYSGGRVEFIGALDGTLYGITRDGTLVGVHHAWDNEYVITTGVYSPCAEPGEHIRRQSNWMLADAYMHLTMTKSFEAHTAIGKVTVPKGAEITVIRMRLYDLPGSHETVFFTYEGEECFVILDAAGRLNGVQWYSSFRA